MKHTPGPWVVSDARSTKVDLINTRTGIDAVHRTRDNVVKTPVVVEGISYSSGAR